MGRALALDLATRTGWAHGDPAGAAPIWPRPVAAAKIAFGVFALPSDAGEGRTFALFADWLAARLDEWKIGSIAMEQAFIYDSGDSQRTARRLFGLRTVALLIAHRRGLPIGETAPMTIKKRFAGSGKAEKAEIIEECWARGYEPHEDNAADAIALWHAAFLPLGDAPVLVKTPAAKARAA